MIHMMASVWLEKPDYVEINCNEPSLLFDVRASRKSSNQKSPGVPLGGGCLCEAALCDPKGRVRMGSEPPCRCR